MAWISIQKAETVRFFIKILQNALFRSVAARFGQIAFLSVKVLKMVKLASNSLQNGKTVRFSWKLYKTLFSGHAQHVLAKSQFWPSKFSKTSPWPEILLKKGNSALFIKIVQNADFRSCGARFGQIAFLSVKFLKIVKWPGILAKRGNSTLIKIKKRSFQVIRSTFCPNGIFWASKFSKSSHWPQTLYKTEKQRAFYENCTKRSFQVRRSTFWPNQIFERQKLSKSSQWPEILAKTGKQYPFHQNYTKRSFQVMRSTFWPNRILERQSS